MLRKDFLKSCSIFAAGALLNPPTSFSRIHSYTEPARGYLIKIFLNPSMRSMHDNYKTTSESPQTATGLVEKSVDTMAAAADEAGIQYKIFQNEKVLPIKNTPALNGVAYGQSLPDPGFKAIQGKASTAMHTHMWKPDATQQVDLTKYCDKSVKQTFDEDNIVFVRPLSAVPWIDPVYMFQGLDHILYNPKYWCLGLPVENPKYNYVTNALEKEIYNSNTSHKFVTQKYYRTQQFKYSNHPCGGDDAEPTYTTIWWDFDEAISEYFHLKPVQPCGDPGKGEGCSQLPGSINARPNFRP